MTVAVPIPGHRSSHRAAKAAALALATLVLMIMLAVAGGTLTNPAPGSYTVAGVSDQALREIPAEYLRDYQRAGQAYGLDWAMLAGSGWIETKHGQLQAPGVTSGINAYGCCAGPAQFNITGAALLPSADGPMVRAMGRRRVGSSGPGTWGSMGVDGDGDGWIDVWDPADAIMAMARYYRASGAPTDWASAVRIYSGGNVTYLAEMKAKAQAYRGATSTVVGGTQALPDAVAGGDRLERLVGLANALEAARIPYCYGGGHGVTPAAPTAGQYCWGGSPLRKQTGTGAVGLDCSSSVSWLLQSDGYQLTTMTSGAFMSWGQPGPGRAVTIWANPDHVYLQINLGGHAYYFGTSTENYRHGPGWHSPRSGAGFVARHPEGL